MPSTAMQGLPYPASNASNDVSVDMKLLGEAVEKQLVQVYATQAALTAANPSPTNGQVCFITADNEYYVRANGAWKLLFKDTGWVTTNLDIVPQTGWTIASYRLRRIDSRVEGSVYVNRTGGTITPSSNGNFTDSPIFAMPVGWRNGSGNTAPLVASQNGVKSAFGRADPNTSTGTVTLTHGIPGVDVDGTNAWQIPLFYTVD